MNCTFARKNDFVKFSQGTPYENALSMALAEHVWWLLTYSSYGSVFLLGWVPYGQRSLPCTLLLAWYPAWDGHSMPFGRTDV